MGHIIRRVCLGLEEAVKIPIFAFHKVGQVRSKYWLTREMLFAKLQLLHSLGYETVTMGQFETLSQSVKDFITKPCILTFDDAYENFLTDAVPVLDRFGFKATIFVPTGLVGKSNRGWENHDIVPVQHLNRRQIEELSAAGHDFQPHTVHHFNLLAVTESVQRLELWDSRRQLEDITQKRGHVLCYPGGGYNDAVKNIVQDCGYTMAVTCDEGVEDTDTMDKLALKRVMNYSEIV